MAKIKIWRLADSSKANSAMLFSWIKMVTFTKLQKKSKSGRKIHWVCRDYDRDKNKKCYAKATTDGIHIIEFHVAHSHPVTEFHRQNYDRKYQIQK